ncbi:MAG: hypothetical protein M1830_008290 [Pleopsidium flavum]|nr:MAG: hypothetical protein M1830_008290 [Pleopsidium flavum]
MAEITALPNAISSNKNKSNRGRCAALPRLTDSQVDAAAVFLTPDEHNLLVWYDKEDLGFGPIAAKSSVKTTVGALPKLYEQVRTKLQAALTAEPAPLATTMSSPLATTMAPTITIANVTFNLASTTMTEPTDTTTANQSEEKESIPMDDPRRVYKVPGTPYAYVQHPLVGNLSGHPNTPEEQKIINDHCNALYEKYKGATDEEIYAVITKTTKELNEEFEANRLLNEDIDRQQAELTAQREVERRVYYRQKALKEAKKKEKEERKRARAIARGEVVEEGEASGNASAQAQASGEGPSGVVEKGSTGAHDQTSVTENGSMGAHDQAL